METFRRVTIRRLGQNSNNDSVYLHAQISDSSYVRRIEQLLGEAHASGIVDRVIFGGSFVTGRLEPNDFDGIVVLQARVRYETLQLFQRWVADTREASRRYRGDIFVARSDQPTLAVYRDFFAMNRQGKQVGLVEVTL